MTVRDALNSALDEEMERDKDVFILGEEVRKARRRGEGNRPHDNTAGARSAAPLRSSIHASLSHTCIRT